MTELPRTITVVCKNGGRPVRLTLTEEGWADDNGRVLDADEAEAYGLDSRLRRYYPPHV